MKYNSQKKIEGYLYKRKTSSFKRMFSLVNKRWFELNCEDKLIRYKTNLEDEFEDDEKKRIPISEISYVKRLENEKAVHNKRYQHGFQIIFIENRREPMTLYAINLTDISKWIVSLTGLLKEKDNEIIRENLISEVNGTQFEESIYDTMVNQKIIKRKEKNKIKQVHFNDSRINESKTSFEGAKNIIFGEVESNEGDDNEVIIENEFKKEPEDPSKKMKTEKKEGNTLQEKIKEEKVYKINEDDLNDWNFYDKQGNIVPFELKIGEKMKKKKNILGPNIEILYTKGKNDTESENSEEQEEGKKDDDYLFKYRKETIREKKKEPEAMKFQTTESKKTPLHSQHVKSLSNVISKSSYDNFEHWTF